LQSDVEYDPKVRILWYWKWSKSKNFIFEYDFSKVC